MKKVFQTRFGTSGNCFAACVATLLGMTIEEAEPCSCGSPDGIVEGWSENARAFLALHGYFLLSVKWDSSGTDPCPFYSDSFAPGSLCILSGPSPRSDYLHAVVGSFAPIKRDDGTVMAWSIVHDPYEGAEETIKSVVSIDWLVPLHPGRMQLKP